MGEQYFEASPRAASKVRTIELTLDDLTLHLDADRGTFSADRVDPGTMVLLSEAARPTAQATTILDLGCGWGPIACAVARRAPEAAVWAVDVNERALALCAANAERHRLRVTAVTADAVPTDLRFDLIVSNPPIRIGKPALHELLTHWLDRLSPTGHAELVVQKNLGSDSLARWLNESGWPTERLISRNSYRVLIVRPREQPTCAS